LIFGSLLEKWNTFAPLKLDPEVRRFAEESLLISRYQLTTCAVPLAGGMQVGFIGWCEFTAVVLDPYWLAAMNLLADFAFYAGTGAKTTMGMGQTRRIGLKERR
jgi:CRISPR-associated endoribonuclease Cas6